MARLETDAFLKNLQPTTKGDLIEAGERVRVTGTSLRRAELNHQRAVNTFRKKVGAMLNEICTGSLPLSQRAALTAAFHSREWAKVASITTFVELAEICDRKLRRIHNLLEEESAPILTFRTGSFIDPDIQETGAEALQYAYRESLGKGLAYQQLYNETEHFYYHTATADEFPLRGRVRSLSPMTHYGAPLISRIKTGALVDMWTTPEEAVQVLRFEDSRDTTKLLIGNEAITRFYNLCPSNARADLILGHALRLGFRPHQDV